MIKFLAFLLMVAATSTAHGENYYVSPDGGGAECTQTNPCYPGSVSLYAGDIMYFLPGIYRDRYRIIGIGIKEAPVYLTSLVTHEAYICGTFELVENSEHVVLAEFSVGCNE